MIARNAACLLAFALVVDLATQRFAIEGNLRRQLVAGVTVGILGFGIMASAFDVAPGVGFDARFVLLAVSGLFLGAVPTLAAMALVAALLLVQGGTGAGLGLAAILASGGIGILWRHRRKGELERIGAGELVVLGLVVHGVALSLSLTLAGGAVWPRIRIFAVPILVVFPAATAALGGFLAMRLRDVADQRRAAEKLRLRSAALEAADNAIVITDRAGTIEWVNRAFIELYGYTLDDVVGRNPREVVRSGVHGPEFYAGMWRTLLAGRTWRGRITNRRSDGSLFQEDLAITPIRDDAGEIAHFIAVKQDLTQWQEMEQRLAIAQKLESVGKLAGGVAHDFNNLLTVVNGTMDVVLTELPKEHPLRPDLEAVRLAGEGGSRLTHQLLAFSRRQPQRREVLDLHDLVVGMMSLLQRLIGENMEISHRFEGEAPLVLADRTQIEQVVVNLVVNARDAMPHGGTLAIGIRTVHVVAGNPVLLPGMDPGQYVRITFRDSGTGIDPAIRTRIFDPFFTTKEKSKGTGLGLATVHGIVSQSGGSINVESEPGAGARFEIHLPRANASAPDGSSGSPPDGPAIDSIGPRR